MSLSSAGGQEPETAFRPPAIPALGPMILRKVTLFGAESS
jgi:hypothetical protein